MHHKCGEDEKGKAHWKCKAWSVYMKKDKSSGLMFFYCADHMEDARVARKEQWVADNLKRANVKQPPKGLTRKKKKSDDPTRWVLDPDGLEKEAKAKPKRSLGKKTAAKPKRSLSRKGK